MNELLQLFLSSLMPLPNFPVDSFLHRIQSGTCNASASASVLFEAYSRVFETHALKEAEH
jgi:hypothetical protein